MHGCVAKHLRIVGGRTKCIPVDSMSVAESSALPPHRRSRLPSRPAGWRQDTLGRLQHPWSTVSYNIKKGEKQEKLPTSFRDSTTVNAYLIKQSIPDPGVEVPLNKELGSKSIPRVFLTDLRFLFENPKEWPDSRGSFRFEEGVAITGVAEEKTGKNHKRINVFEWAGFSVFCI